MKASTYYDTTNAHAGQLELFTKKAASQNALMLRYFKLNKGYPKTASDVHIRVFCGMNVPLTSTRRALSTLARRGHLVKLQSGKPGHYGREEKYYQLAF